MKEIKSTTLQEIMKKSQKSLWIWIVVILCSVVLFGIGLFNDEQLKKKSTNLHELLAQGEMTENKMVHIDVSEIPYVFAYYPDDNSGKFYFVWDETYMYMAFLSESQYNELNRDDIQSNPMTIYGVTKRIPDDIRDLALEAYNEAVDEGYEISESEFYDYFGNLYLDETEMNLQTVICIILGAIVFFVGIIGLITAVIVRSRLKSKMKKISDEDWEILNREMDEADAFYYKSAKLSLTKHYIVDFSNGLSIIPYQDVLWMYKYEYRYNGVKTQISIILFTKDKKRRTIASLPGYTKKSKEINQEIMETIMKKNGKIVVGYTKENRTKMKEEYQIKA